VLLTGWPRPPLDRVLPWLRALGRALVAPPAFHPTFPAMADDSDAGRLDAAAGCEFVDDQIRHPE
jgi:hypothetical protein